MVPETENVPRMQKEADAAREVQETLEPAALTETIPETEVVNSVVTTTK